MNYKITAPRRLEGTVVLPASKSISNRVLIISALAQSGLEIGNLSACDDTFVVRRALREPSATTDIMAAGTAMRFLTAMFAATPGVETTLTGTERMLHRPIHILVEALRQLGADIEYAGEEGFPPLRITGRRLPGGDITLAGNVSSQFTSALLMAGPTMSDGLRLRLTGKIISRPYINMTLALMNAFGADARWEGDDTLRVLPKTYRPREFVVESDWSAASYWYEMVALSGDLSARVVLPRLFRDSLQGDSQVARLFEPLGVRTAFGDEGVCLTAAPTEAVPYVADLESQPDLAQTIVVTCAMLGRPFRISGLQSLRIKETDRLTALRVELAKLGIAIREENGDTLLWGGETCPQNAAVGIDTYEDHRMAMAFAPCALVRDDIRINHVHVVSKSYTDYWRDLQAVGFKLDEA